MLTPSAHLSLENEKVLVARRCLKLVILILKKNHYIGYISNSSAQNPVLVAMTSNQAMESAEMKASVKITAHLGLSS